MILVIFGAGASYDSVPTLKPAKGGDRDRAPNRPPLAAELFLPGSPFGNCLRKFPRCQPIAPYLINTRADSIEQELEKLQAESESDAGRAPQMASIRYYLQSLIWECENHWGDIAKLSNYSTLIDQLRRAKREVLLVTFNYDTLLEKALGSVDLKFEGIDQYIGNGVFKVFKLHGSVNWGRAITGGYRGPPSADSSTISQWLIENVTRVSIGDEFRVFPKPPFDVSEGIAYFPAIAIPVERKRVFECPRIHLDALIKRLGLVRKVIVVGWRAAEQHFLELWRQHASAGASIQVVAGGRQGAEETLSRIIAAGIPVEGHALDGGFSEYAVGRMAEQFLVE